MDHFLMRYLMDTTLSVGFAPIPQVFNPTIFFIWLQFALGPRVQKEVRLDLVLGDLIRIRTLDSTLGESGLLTISSQPR